MAALESIRPDVHLVRIPMPGGGLPFSLCYLLVDAAGDVHVIDPGSPGAQTLTAIAGALDALGKRFDDVRTILVTHLHPDHAGAVDALHAATGARVLLHERERPSADAGEASTDPGDASLDAPLDAVLDEWGVPADRRAELPALPPRLVAPVAEPVDLLADGDLLDLPGLSLRALWTPGHTAGHLCFDDERRGLLFTGDHVLPTVNPGLGLGGPAADPVGDYLRSLRRVAELDRQALPGHEAPFSTLRERCAELAEHQLRRSREVRDALGEHPQATTWQVAQRLTWTGGWSALAGFTLRSALSQTEMHRAFVRSGAPIAW